MFLTAPCLVTAPTLQVVQLPNDFHCTNGLVQVNFEKAGSYSISWPNGNKISHLTSEAVVNGKQTVTVESCSFHGCGKGDIRSVSDAFGRGVQITIHHRSEAKLELTQQFWVYESAPEVFVRLDVKDSRSIQTNSITPLVTTSPLAFKANGPIQSLFVPYDNDGYARFRSDAWKESTPSSEVGALYCDATREGIVVGSVDHDTWKSGVRFGTPKSGVRAFAGMTSSFTHDSQPHGSVSGKVVSSPRFVIGCYSDWRFGMERFGELNAKVAPALPWKQGVPFGWSSWSGHKTKLTAGDALAATDFIKWQVPDLRSGGTAYINLDSFWDNLSEDQRREFVRHAHSLGLKAGIYYTPFTAWGNLTDPIDGTKDTYADIILKGEDGRPLPKLDGGYPIDPTHPAALARVDRELASFVEDGYDFVKLDFLTHAALEARHFDPKVQTGTQAYSLGMRHILRDLSPSKAGRPIFVALSIAPLFPSGLGHSRRISCDIFANIGATEYLLNSSAYGWWEGGTLYAFNDADSSCVYQPLDEPAVSMEESVSRLTASVISGGIVIEGDNLKDPAARARATKLFSNPEVLALARKAVSFRPVEASTGNMAGTVFSWQDPGSGDVYIAVFNVDKLKAKTVYVPHARLGLNPSGFWECHDLWTGENTGFAGTLVVMLKPMSCRLIRLHLRK